MTSRPAPALGRPPVTPAPTPAPTLSPPSTLFTIGYEKRDLAAYVELLTEARVGVLVDVRATAWSYKPGFSKSPLRQAIEGAGIEYEHAAFAGNPKALRAAAPTHAACLAAYRQHLDANPDVVVQLDELVADHAASGRAACLTCFERHPGDCHRAILAARWVAVAPAHRTSTHLGPDGCPRLTPEGFSPEGFLPGALTGEGDPREAGPLVAAPRGVRITASRRGIARVASHVASRAAPRDPRAAPGQLGLW